MCRGSGSNHQHCFLGTCNFELHLVSSLCMFTAAGWANECIVINVDSFYQIQCDATEKAQCFCTTGVTPELTHKCSNPAQANVLNSFSHLQLFTISSYPTREWWCYNKLEIQLIIWLSCTANWCSCYFNNFWALYHRFFFLYEKNWNELSVNKIVDRPLPVANIHG